MIDTLSQSPAALVASALLQVGTAKAAQSSHDARNEAAGTTNRTLVLGLGNDILSDDAVGLHIAQQLRARLADRPNVDVIETCEMGLSLLDFMDGYRQVLIVDSVQTGKVPAGQMHEIEASELKTLPEMSPHFLGIGEVLSLGTALGLNVPQRVKILAIEVADPFTVSTTMTPAICQAVPAIIERAVNCIDGLSAAAAIPFGPT
jgi:hydrogenase maturation protease